ncbi:MAG TPA: DNA methyltransferase [Anaerolineales bacterium]|nr:DNA methyltransferase [Anaerolineales bacterium]
MPRPRRTSNRLNDLESKAWLKFQKSWFVHNPPPRNSDVLRHPAKFPESLAREFIEFFTHRGETVLDPMVGTGSTLLACLECGRNGVGVELNPAYVALARQRLDEALLANPGSGLRLDLRQADAAHLADLALPPCDYVFTSPPYWDMLRAAGAATQQRRRAAEDLDVTYSDDPADLGNVSDYQVFLERLAAVYTGLQPFLRTGAYLTVIVKNVKKGGRVYPLAWDLARRLAEVYTLKDEKIWCQDNIRLAPYGLGNAWVSNTFHHYCLQFRKEE